MGANATESHGQNIVGIISRTRRKCHITFELATEIVRIEKAHVDQIRAIVEMGNRGNDSVSSALQ